MLQAQAPRRAGSGPVATSDAWIRLPLWHLWLQLALEELTLWARALPGRLVSPWLTPFSITPAFGPLPPLSTASLCCSPLSPCPENVSPTPEGMC